MLATSVSATPIGVSGYRFTFLIRRIVGFGIPVSNASHSYAVSGSTWGPLFSAPYCPFRDRRVAPVRHEALEETAQGGRLDDARVGVVATAGRPTEVGDTVPGSWPPPVPERRAAPRRDLVPVPGPAHPPRIGGVRLVLVGAEPRQLFERARELDIGIDHGAHCCTTRQIAFRGSRVRTAEMADRTATVALREAQAVPGRVWRTAG